MKTQIITLILLIIIGLLCGLYYRQQLSNCADICATLHRTIVDGEASSPYRYRVLSALLVQSFAGQGSTADILQAYNIAHFITLPAMFIMLYAWLREWGSPRRAWMGVFMVALLMPLMLNDWGISLYTPIEVIILCAGLMLLKRQPRHWLPLYAGLIIIGTLNRETTILLPLAFLCIRPRSWKLAGFFFGLWITVYISLRLTLGSAPDALTISQTWTMNTRDVWASGLALIKQGLFIPLWVVYAVRFASAPAFVRRLAPILLFYLALVAIFGLWHEVRLLLPALILTLPIITLKRRKSLQNVQYSENLWLNWVRGR